MDAATIAKLVLAGFDAYETFMASYPKTREAYSTSDQTVLDSAYADLKAKSNAIADRLRATPDDPV